MTATLADDSVIVTHFGAVRNNLKKPIVPSSSQSMGERMILLPQELNPDLTTADVQRLLATLARDVNVVVIVPSKSAAEHWRQDAGRVLVGDEVPEGVEELREKACGAYCLGKPL